MISVCGEVIEGNAKGLRLAYDLAESEEKDNFLWADSSYVEAGSVSNLHEKERA